MNDIRDKTLLDYNFKQLSTEGEVNSTWLITELANQRARELLFTCSVVYTNIDYSANTDIQLPCRICLLASTMIILNDALKIKFCPQLSRAKLVVVLSEAFS